MTEKWQEEAKVSPCWIFSYPRTGSSYLASSLNYTALYNPVCYEWLNPKVDKRESPTVHQETNWEPWKNISLEAIENSIEPFLNTLPLNLKIHVFDYKIFFKKEHLPEIRRRIPGLKIIRIRRKDAIAATASYYLADMTNTYAVAEEEEIKKHAQICVPIDEKKLLQYYEWIIWWDEECGGLLDETPYDEVFFEDLFRNGEVNLTELRRIHSILGIPEEGTLRCLSRIKDKKLNHPQTPVIQETLRKLISSV